VARLPVGQQQLIRTAVAGTAREPASRLRPNDGSGEARKAAERPRMRVHIDLGHRPEVPVGGTRYRPRPMSFAFVSRAQQIGASAAADRCHVTPELSAEPSLPDPDWRGSGKGSVALPHPAPSHPVEPLLGTSLWHPQRDSNPCRHLERARGTDSPAVTRDRSVQHIRRAEPSAPEPADRVLTVPEGLMPRTQSSGTPPISGWRPGRHPCTPPCRRPKATVRDHAR